MCEKKSVTLERAIMTYPPPLYCQYVRNYAEVRGKSESKIVSEAIKQYFDGMPESEKNKLKK
jgi:hypothetical protein